MGYGTKKYLYPLHITVDTVCAYYPLWNSDRCSKASSMNSFYCLAPPDSSLCSSPHVLFLIKAFRIFCRCIKTNMSTDDCQVGIYFRIALNLLPHSPEYAKTPCRKQSVPTVFWYQPFNLHTISQSAFAELKLSGIISAGVSSAKRWCGAATKKQSLKNSLQCVKVGT